MTTPNTIQQDLDQLIQDIEGFAKPIERRIDIGSIMVSASSSFRQRWRHLFPYSEVLRDPEQADRQHALVNSLTPEAFQCLERLCRAIDHFLSPQNVVEDEEEGQRINRRAQEVLDELRKVTP